MGNKQLRLTCLLAALWALAAACSPGAEDSASAEGNGLPLTGSVAVAPVDDLEFTGLLLDRYSSLDRLDGKDCSDGAGYADLVAGARIVVKDGAGAIVGTGSLGAGTLTGLAFATLRCTFDFSLSVQPADFYEVSIGQRSPLTYSTSELDAVGWTLDLSIGETSCDQNPRPECS